MRTLIILFAIVAVSSAASILTMDDKEFEKAMMEHMASQGMMHPMMSFLALMDTQEQQQHPEPEAVEAESEPASEEAAQDGAEEPADDQKEVAPVEAEDPKPQFTMFANGMTAMVFPDMSMAAFPFVASKPSKKPAGISSNNNKHELANGNGNRGGGGSAAAASASSFSKGANSFSGSQAQAFSGGFSQGS